MGYAGAACDRCAPPAFRNATAPGGACVLPRAGVRLQVRAWLRGVPNATLRDLAAVGAVGDAARATFAATLQADLRRALGLPAATSSPASSARRQLQPAVSGNDTASAAVLEVPPKSVLVVDAAAGAVSANVTLAPPAAAAATAPTGGSDSSSAASFDTVVARLLSLLEQSAAGAAAGAVWGGGATLAAYVDAQATLTGLADAAAAGAAFALLPAVAPPSAYTFRVQLGPDMSLEWAAPSVLPGGAVGGSDRVHVRLTCAAGGGWCGVGVNRAAVMTGAVAVALEPGRAPGSQLSAWTLGAYQLGVELPSAGSASSPLNLALGTPATVVAGGGGGAGGAGTLVATWAWPVSAAHGHLRTDELMTLIYATGPGGTLGGHSSGSAGAVSVNFGTGAAVALDLHVKRTVVAHAVFMLLGWLALAPLGIAVARFGKGWLGSGAAAAAKGDDAAAAPASPPVARWFPAHWQIQLCGQLAALVGVVIVLATRPAGVAHFATAHERLGLAVFLVGLLQPLLASKCVRPAKAPGPEPQPRARAAWEAVHKTAGYGGVVAAAAAVFLGLAQARWSSERALTGVFAAYLALAACAFVALEVRARSAPPPPPPKLAAHPAAAPGAAGAAKPASEQQWSKCDSLRSNAIWGALRPARAGGAGEAVTAAAAAAPGCVEGVDAGSDSSYEQDGPQFAGQNPLSQRGERRRDEFRPRFVA